MTTSPVSDPAALVDRAVEAALPGRRGAAAWRSLLTAHASLVRELGTELLSKTGLSIGDFDVLAQLAIAGGELRMTDLANRAFSSRSGMTRRVDRLVGIGLAERTNAAADARGVVVALTDAGRDRLAETLPIHLAGVSRLFVDKLTDEELAVLERALDKVTLDCSFG